MAVLAQEGRALPQWFGDCENKFLCSEVLPQVSQEEKRIPPGLLGYLGSIRAQHWFQLERDITSTCCLASSAHRAQEGVQDVQTRTQIGIRTL